MRKLLLAAALLLCSQAHAASAFSTDVTDLWWNPDESGWGINIIQQSNVVFATFFVYGPDNAPHWYVASNMTADSASPSGATFLGDLFETNGPYFAVPFNPAAVGRRRVGTATLQFALPDAAILTYTVDGASVTKQIRRQTWALNDISGQYTGSRATRNVAGSPSACPGRSGLGFTSFTNINLSVISASRLTMSGNLGGTQCNFGGDYSQDGRLGASSGTFSCDNGISGTYSMSEIEGNFYGFFARYSGMERGCTVEGRIGGVRTTIRALAE